MILHKRWVLLFFIASTLCAVGQERADKEPVRIGTAVLETAAANAVLFSFNRLVTREEYAQVSPETIKANLTSSWVWDQDAFEVNHIGHPYHGSYYFISGRSNGLSFWSSTLLGLGGSLSWELFCESETPSRNDLISTTLGGTALGEMLHRLFRAAAASRSPFKILLSPMDALNGTPGQPFVRGGFVPDLRYSLSLGAGAVLAAPDERGLTIPAAAGVQLDLDYGSPFVRDSKDPFSSFGLTCTVAGTPEEFVLRFLSDGNLRSWVLQDENAAKTGAGFSLHYDFVLGSGFNFVANSLGATLEHEQSYRGFPYLELKAHANWMVLGASDNSALRELYAEDPPDQESRDYDMGTGVGIKLALRLSHPVLGSLALTAYRAGLFLFPVSGAAEGEEGSVWIDILRAAYEQGLWSRTRVGAFFGVYRKSTRYTTAPNRTEIEADAGIYLKRIFSTRRSVLKIDYAAAESEGSEAAAESGT